MDLPNALQGKTTEKYFERFNTPKRRDRVCKPQKIHPSIKLIMNVLKDILSSNSYSLKKL